MLRILQFFFTLILFSTVAISCDPVGETIAEEKPLDDQLVNTTENLDLKKGDVLVIWGKIDASFVKNNNIPVFLLNYNLSLDGKVIKNEQAQMFLGRDKIINSTHEIRKEEIEEDEKEEQSDSETSEYGSNSTETREEKPEKIAESDWTFEQEVIKIPIEKDGKYTLDYKASSDNESARSMFTKVSVILRKK